jgi:hypothetical protein
MRIITSLIAIVLSLNLWAQSDPLIEAVKKTYANSGVQCSVAVHIEIPGLKMPDKDLFIRFVPNEKPIIKGSGMMLVPKKGLAGQFNEVFEANSQIIFLGNTSDTALYKIVSLDQSSDWVTADVKIYRPDQRVYFMDIFTKEFGSFKVKHQYETLAVPVKSTISFEAEAFKLPLKFMGRGDTDDLPTDENGKVNGKVILRYSEIELL